MCLVAVALVAACGPDTPPWPAAGLAETGEATGSDGSDGSPPDMWNGIPDPSCPDIELGSSAWNAAEHSTWDQASNFVPSCGSPDSDGPDAEFIFVSPRTSRWVFTTEDSDFDTILTVHDGYCGGPELACNDDYIPGTVDESAFLLELQAEQVVTVVVNGKNGETGQARVIVREAYSGENQADIELGRVGGS